ncbi:MAG: glycosyltransferase [Planctomycetota bacterium]|nr:glycosyltransferase [Planctomycetota bacterium]
MIAPYDTKHGPLVSVLVPTFNRRRYLAGALRSLVRQTYPHFEAFVVNDGGEPVADLVASFNDPRLIMLDRRENRGKAFSLNQALQHASGKYVAYLDDDDLYYPHHLATLVEALETQDDCHAAYTDLYKVHCRVEPDGSRQVLGKVVNISRDFDRFFLCHFNHVLHVSLAHRRDLLDRTGLYNEDLRVLIDWDMTRRLAFFTDFLHLPEVTGEFYGPVGACDRISYRMRLDKVEYLKQVLTIRTARPAKPWPKMPDLSIIYLPDTMDASVGETLRHIWLWTFMPYEVYLPLPSRQLSRLDTQMPMLVPVPVSEGASRAVRLRAALAKAGGDYVAVVQPGAQVKNMWVEDALHAAIQDAEGKTVFLLAGAPSAWPPVVVRRNVLTQARAAHPHADLRESLEAAGIAIREPAPTERPFQFDDLLQQAQALEAEGAWFLASQLYTQIGQRYGNSRWMRQRAAAAIFSDGAHNEKALAICRELNEDRPTVDTLLLEAKLLKRAGKFDDELALLDRAKTILAWKG